MLEIEVIKFEATDVITTSGAAPESATVSGCTNAGGHTAQVTITDGTMKFVCSHCGTEVSATGSIVGGN